MTGVTSSGQLPLVTLLSQALVAFTIEFDNEFEHRMPHRTAATKSAGERGTGPWLVSQAMWENAMSFVPAEGIETKTLQRISRLARTDVDGLRRWRYVTVSGRELHPTPDGRRAQSLWAPLGSEIEDRWSERSGSAAVDRLRTSLLSVVSRFERPLPRYLPTVGYGLVTSASLRPVDATGASDIGAAQGVAVVPDAHTARENPPEVANSSRALSVLLARSLTQVALEFESGSRLGLALAANTLASLTTDGVLVRELPVRSGIAKEVTAVGLGYLQKAGLVEVSSGSAKSARLTSAGSRAQSAAQKQFNSVETDLAARFGRPAIVELRESLEALRPEIDAGLHPYPDGWRASRPYLAQTVARLEHPELSLPRFPVVTHRGGYPDGS